MVLTNKERLIKRYQKSNSCTSCDSLVVEWSVAIASTRVQFPVTAFLINTSFLTNLSTTHYHHHSSIFDMYKYKMN